MLNIKTEHAIMMNC